MMVVRPLLKKAIRSSRPRDGKMSANLLGGLLAVIFIAAMTTYQIGIFAIFGGFMMGVILYDEAELVAAWRVPPGRFRHGVLPADLLYLHGSAHFHRRNSRGGGDWGLCLGIVATASLAKLVRRLFGGAPLRIESSGVCDHRLHDEHPRLDGAHRDQRRTGSRRDIAQDIHDVGHHGDCQHRDHHARAALLHASSGPRAVRRRRRGRRWRYGAANFAVDCTAAAAGLRLAEGVQS